MNKLISTNIPQDLNYTIPVYIQSKFGENINQKDNI